MSKNAIGICDRCGFQYPYNDLKHEVVNRKLSAIKVCPDCWDPDHPQHYVGLVKTDDPKPLKEPRPPQNLVHERSFFGWNPTTGVYAEGKVGTVTVITS